MEPLKSSKVLILYLVCVFKRTQHKIYIYREIDGWIDIMLCSLIKKCGVPGDTEARLVGKRMTHAAVSLVTRCFGWRVSWPGQT